MATPIESEVRATLACYGRDYQIRKVIDQAFATVQTKYSDGLGWFRRKSTMRALVWEYAVDGAVEAFESAPGVQILVKDDTRSFVFDDSVLLRIKKADDQFLTSNFPTRQARMFHDHGRVDLFGFEGHQRVEAIYVMNQFETAIRQISIVARQHKNLLWAYDLPVEEGAVVAPFPTHQPALPAADRILRSRMDIGDKSEDQDA
mgnify:CR=1 FL=1